MRLVAFITVLICVFLASPGRAQSPCHDAIAAAEQQFRIPDQFLSAIGRVESGRPDQATGAPIPWPWTIDAEGTGHFYASKAEAVAAAREFLARGIRSLDVGCLQVNLQQHPDAFASLDAAFDPAANALYAARLLLLLFGQTGSWPHAAAAYHSQTPGLGAGYAEKVLAEWARPDRPAPAEAVMPSRPGLPVVITPISAMPAGGFVRSFRLPGAASESVGRSLAAYRQAPVAFALRPPRPAG